LLGWIFGTTLAAFLINLVLYFRIGAVYPINGSPNWMQELAVAGPEAYAVHDVRLLMCKSASIIAVSNDLAFLPVFSAIVLAKAGSRRAF
jgi:hypothetical protein